MMNNRGAITIDYLFAFFLVSGFSLVIMAFSATLSVVEVVQYISYSSARNYFAGHVSEEKQKERAKIKFAELKQNPVIAPLLNGGWFEVPDQSLIVDSNIPEKYPEFKDYVPEDPEINLFHGVVLTLNAKILDFQVPFFGSTKIDDRGNESRGFSTKITSFLGREPSFVECHRFNENRWSAIKKLRNSIGAASYSAARGDGDYVVINDNGC